MHMSLLQWHYNTAALPSLPPTHRSRSDTLTELLVQHEKFSKLTNEHTLQLNKLKAIMYSNFEAMNVLDANVYVISLSFTSNVYSVPACHDWGIDRKQYYVLRNV